MTDSRAKILLVDDEPIKSSVLSDRLQAAGYAVSSATNPIEARPLLETKTFDVVITDLRMPGQDGLTFLRELKAARPDQQVMVMTAYGTVSTAVEAMKLGAIDYLQKPFAAEELMLKLQKVLQYEQLTSENERLREQLARSRAECKIIGHSAPMRMVFERIEAVAPLDTTVLIEGESGTGKELVARTIHDFSLRRDGPFVAVSCAALPQELMESELFGHEAGAFTGATSRRLGRFETAHGGTIFLDDVDDIPRSVQVKLLRVLQERVVERVGSAEPIRVNVRVLAATKVPLAALVSSGDFREDLYYRLCVVPVQIPPLRDRWEDIPLLANHFLQRLAKKMNRGNLSLTNDAVKRLQQYSWPGNVREMEHFMERMVAISKNSEFDVDDIPDLDSPGRSEGIVSLALQSVHRVDIENVVGEVECRLVRWALDQADGNLARAAELLNVPRSTLQYKVSKLG